MGEEGKKNKPERPEPSGVGNLFPCCLRANPCLSVVFVSQNREVKMNQKKRILNIPWSSWLTNILLATLFISCHREKEEKFWDDLFPIFSSNGRYISFQRHFQVLIDPPHILDTLSGTRILNFSTLTVIDSLIAHFCSDWSPNGEEIITSGGGIYNLETHNMKTIWDTSSHLVAYDWSPDGKRILCTAKSDSPDSTMILMVDTLGLNMKILFNSGMAPSWHPSGEQLVFIATLNGEKKICIGDTNGNIIRSIIPKNGDLSIFAGKGPQCSPDGSKIVYYLYSLNDGGLDDFYIHVCDSLGKNDVVLIDGVHPDWSPDGKTIVFSRYDNTDSLFSLWVMNPDGTNLRRITK